MRVTAAALVALALFGAAHAQEGLFQRDHGKVPPPSSLGVDMGAVPPEGVAAGGLDFGAWRGVNAAAYGEALRARIAARIDGKPLAAARADLEANGFRCLEARERSPRAPALECRIAITDRACAIEWWAVREDALSPVKAGHDVMCARR
ncbi:MAG: hypothetical protein NW200_05085 [Hyphomonadaceae bacterium]|nr:hypothetical protein [Hyphomonadaceae bacterium]